VRGGDGRFGIACAGDTFNVAVYLARAGVDAAFATALGDDPYSETIVALAAASSPTWCTAAARAAAWTRRGRRRPIRRAPFACDWRGEAPARELFETPEWGRVAEGLMTAKLVYFSGITLSLYSNNGLDASSPSSRWPASRA
jgi:2-dehydro-3-deoxygluconokinase